MTLLRNYSTFHFEVNRSWQQLPRDGYGDVTSDVPDTHVWKGIVQVVAANKEIAAGYIEATYNGVGQDNKSFSKVLVETTDAPAIVLTLPY